MLNIQGHSSTAIATIRLIIASLSGPSSIVFIFSYSRSYSGMEKAAWFGFGGRVGAVKQLEEVLRVGVVCHPARRGDLEGPLDGPFEILGERVDLEFHLDAELLEAPHVEGRLLAGAGRIRTYVVGQLQLLACARVDAARIARLHHKLPGLLPGHGPYTGFLMTGRSRRCPGGRGPCALIARPFR